MRRKENEQVYCLGHNKYVNASDMINNFQHKHQICKACHANIATSKAKEAQAIKDKSMAEHKQVEKEVGALMGSAKPLKKLKPSIHQAISEFKDAMEMNRLMRGEL